jgi:nucleoside-diphosphate-sugar epimerase
MQFSNIYGPRNSTGNLIGYTLDRLLAGEEADFGPALQPYDFIYSEDLIEAVYRLGSEKTEKTAYFIGSGEPRQLKDYLLEMGKIAGRPDLIRIGARPDDGIVYTKEMFDIRDLERAVGKYAETSFTDGIAKTIAARRAQKRNGSA